MRVHSRRFWSILMCPLVLLTVSGCDEAATEVEQLKPEIVQRYDYDPALFTQGLEVDEDGTLLVSTGQYGASGMYRLTTEGDVLGEVALPDVFFGEGMTRVGDSVWQLTWQEGTAFRRDAASLATVDTAHYDGEGWGLCTTDDALIFSDGSAELRRMDPDTLAELARFEVTDQGKPVEGLNELECVGDDVYANIFTTTDIVRIDATSGHVTARIDASSLPNNADEDINNVLNGIAHIPGTDEFYLTGKRWPDLYRVRLVPSQ
ncbi:MULTISPECIES: glutaminyl-peptide cyclotransferase [Corynebacterium]